MTTRIETVVISVRGRVGLGLNVSYSLKVSIVSVTIMGMKICAIPLISVRIGSPVVRVLLIRWMTWVSVALVLAVAM